MIRLSGIAMIDLTRKPAKEGSVMKKEERNSSVSVRKGKKLRSSVKRIVRIVLLSEESAKEKTGRPLGTAVLARIKSAGIECRNSRSRSKGKLSAIRGIEIALSETNSASNVKAVANRG